MLCYVESKFCTVTVIAFPQYFSKTSHILFSLASCALHYDVDWMYDLQDLQLFLRLLKVAPNQYVL